MGGLLQCLAAMRSSDTKQWILPHSCSWTWGRAFQAPAHDPTTTSQVQSTPLPHSQELPPPWPRQAPDLWTSAGDKTLFLSSLSGFSQLCAFSSVDIWRLLKHVKSEEWKGMTRLENLKERSCSSSPQKSFLHFAATLPSGVSGWLIQATGTAVSPPPRDWLFLCTSYVRKWSSHAWQSYLRWAAKVLPRAECHYALLN